MTNARMSAAIDTLVAEVLALLPPGTDVAPFRAALAGAIEALVSAATVQSASATLGVLDEVLRRLQALEGGETEVDGRD